MTRTVFLVVTILALAALSACVQQQAPTYNCNDTGVPLDDIDINAGLDEVDAMIKEDTAVEPPKGTQNATTKPAVPAPTTAPKPVETTTAPAAPADALRKEVVEGQLVSFPKLSATDPDGDKITYTFSKPLDEKGTWQTKAGDAGEHLVTITASDGKTTATQKVLIVVKSANRAPVFGTMAAVSVKEGESVTISPAVSDPDGDKVSFGFSGWMNASTKKTTFNDAGDHVVTITATDGKLSATKDVTVKVANVNRAPVVSPIKAISVLEGEKVVVQPTATDPDGDKVSVTFGAPLDSRGVWETKVGDAGTRDVSVSVSDGTLSDSTKVSITVNKVNRAPVISGLNDLTVDEGKTVTLKPTVTDADNDKVSVTYSGWMTSSTKTTGYSDAGVHDVTVSATDTASNTVKKTIKVTVKDQNRPPTFDPGSFN